MVLLSFSGSTSQGPFWQQILAGRKTQTCREPRKVPIKPGDTLHLYWMVRIPPSKKPVHKIGEAVCTSVQSIQYEDFAWDDAFAIRDGFRDARELQHFFGSVLVYGYLPYDVISWGPIECGINPASFRACPECPHLAECSRVDAEDVEMGAVGKSTTEQWLVRSRKTGVICHAASTQEGAQRWADRFLGEHGEVIAQ